MMFKNIKWQIRIIFIAWIIFLYFMVKPPFGFLILNTILGYIPIELSLELTNKHVKKHWIFWPILILWLIFYPNAPYLLTDLFHLSLLSPYTNEGLLRLSSNMWLSYSYLMISALGCSLIGLYGLFKIVHEIKNKLHIKNKLFVITLIIIFNILASIGIYIGRFLRFHTIYLLLSPKLLINPLINMWTPHMIVFVIILTIIQIFVYWIINLIIKDTKNNF
ncbi:DUF1361 domain-containing protein [Apilactobacillus timberlakei]|nr:DUF1361 domain-containing protein [Apilactobacillus timberlakei]TPR19773.1 DUF1361 domain-containing protein [Apilactobacillus timberlakei]TPR21279.1 DUF1361 domain-containing protein [Apilactobacillus timberlakei]TPR22486.1 DUF1361 domain-containing protein [Apilactobacillus timberlakei]